MRQAVGAGRQKDHRALWSGCWAGRRTSKAWYWVGRGIIEATYLAGSWYWFICSLKIQLSINNECLLHAKYHMGSSRDTEDIRKWTTLSPHGTGSVRKPIKGSDSQWQ